MTRSINTIHTIAQDYDVIVFDQWGVLHNGTVPYPKAVQTIQSLKGTLAVLSNSGKRAANNAKRISKMGFDANAFAHVMTSGEALWQDIKSKRISQKHLLPIERSKGDAQNWAKGLEIDLVDDITQADGILLMGLPDGADLTNWKSTIEQWHSYRMPVFCSNPDLQSPREGHLVTSPGALAHAYLDLGGEAYFYGKPHHPVFAALEQILGKGRYLMVGDSMKHDIKGAHMAGWDSLLIEGGLYAQMFLQNDGDTALAEVTASADCAPPTYRIKGLQ